MYEIWVYVYSFFSRHVMVDVIELNAFVLLSKFLLLVFCVYAFVSISLYSYFIIGFRAVVHARWKQGSGFNYYYIDMYLKFELLLAAKFYFKHDSSNI